MRIIASYSLGPHLGFMSLRQEPLGLWRAEGIYCPTFGQPTLLDLGLFLALQIRPKRIFERSANWCRALGEFTKEKECDVSQTLCMSQSRKAGKEHGTPWLLSIWSKVRVWIKIQSPVLQNGVLLCLFLNHLDTTWSHLGRRHLNEKMSPSD